MLRELSQIILDQSVKYQHRTFEINGVITVLAELLNNKVLSEKPGLLIREVGESQLKVTARSSRSEVEENGPTETDENGPNDHRSATFSRKRKLP
ncbi:hypothetical protein BpHYR1_034249 [Brachionus plicatilis]|uniref:Uncharacterized protein n=1 Tax=Brachionus plicatilis TaxID=10195 RepID=A0A3M7Q653_BRAPC|nr:hypothetical protein BpHYR1_034249 [Brachionus plicatilis]